MLKIRKNENGIIKSIEDVLKTGDIRKLTRSAYEFLYLMSGFKERARRIMRRNTE